MVKKLVLLMFSFGAQLTYPMQDLPWEIKSYIFALIPKLGGYTDFGNLILVNKNFYDICLNLDEYVLNSFIQELIEKAPEKAEEFFVLAIKNRNEQIIKAFMKSNVNANASIKARTALMFACYQGFCDLAELLIKKGANIESTDKQKRTAISYAASGNQTTAAALLIQRGAQVDIIAKTGFTPLAIAVNAKNFEMTTMLIDAGADVNRTFSDNNILLFGVLDNYEMVQLLISCGASINVQNDVGCTPLIVAVGRECYDVARLLIENGAHVDLQTKDGLTALMFAARNGNKELIQLLVDHNADVTICDSNGMTALLFTQEEHSDITEFLMASGADSDKEIARWHRSMNARSKKTRQKRDVEEDLKKVANVKGDSGESLEKLAKELIDENPKLAQELFIKSADYNYKKLLNAFIAQGIDVNCKDDKGFNSLMHCIVAGHHHLIEHLILQGVDIDSANGCGFTPLMIAVLMNNYALVKLLIDNHANLNYCNAIDSSYLTALDLAIRKRYHEIVQLLVDHMDINVKKENGQTALMSAMNEGNYEMAKLLISRGASVNVSERNGITPLMLAVAKKSSDLVELLIKNQALLNTKDNQGLTALHMAVNLEHSTMVHLLLRYGADAKCHSNEKTTALMNAVVQDRYDLAEMLIRYGADINAQGENGLTALIIAIDRHAVEIVNLLVDNGADINLMVEHEGINALALAVGCGYFDIVGILTSNKKAPLSMGDVSGFDMAVQNANGKKQDFKSMPDDADQEPARVKNGENHPLSGSNKMPLHLTSDEPNNLSTTLTIKSKKFFSEGMSDLLCHFLREKPEIVKELFFKAIKHKVFPLISFLIAAVEAGVYDINAKDIRGGTLLDCAVRAGKKNLIKLLLKHGAEVNAKNSRGEISLLIAAERDYYKVVKLLIKKRANVNSKDTQGWTALMIAAKNGHTNVVRELVNNGALIGHQNNSGSTSLMVAIQEGRYSVVKILLDSNSNSDEIIALINIKNNMGLSALMLAAQYGHSQLVTMLIDKGSSVNAQDNTGRTALDFASRYHHEIIVDLLTANGARKGKQTCAIS